MEREQQTNRLQDVACRKQNSDEQIADESRDLHCETRTEYRNEGK